MIRLVQHNGSCRAVGNLEIQTLGMASINIPEFCYPGSQQIVLHDVCIEFEPGDAVLLHGDNASGKSTFGRLLCGLLRPQFGNVLVDGKEIWRLRGRKRVRMAYYLDQEYLLSFYHSTIGGELFHAMHLGGRKFDQSIWINEFSLPDNIDIKPLDLGSCAAWRLGLLCATFVSPKVLFIDELPSIQSASVVECLRKTVQQRKKAGEITVVSYQRPIILENIFTQEYMLVDGEVKK